MLVGRRLQPATVIVDGDRIERVAPADEHVGSARVVDAAGCVIAPGLVDTHVHGALGSNVMEATPEAVDVVRRSLARGGTTSFVATTASVPLPALEASLSALASIAAEPPADGGAAMLGVHLEGPFLSPMRAGVHREEHLLTPSPAAIGRVLDAAGAALRICTIAPELEHGIAAIERLAEAGVVPSIGHTDADLATTATAIEAGARRATHLWNAMPPVHHRAPGAVMAVLADARVRPELVADGMHVAPDMLAAHFAIESIGERVMLVSDGADVSGLPDGPHRRWEGTEVVLDEGVSRTHDGVIAGSTATVLDGVRTLVGAGVALGDALHAASTAPADSLGLPAVGRIAPGATADLIVLDDDLRLRSVVLRGSEQSE